LPANIFDPDVAKKRAEIVEHHGHDVQATQQAAADKEVTQPVENGALAADRPAGEVTHAGVASITTGSDETAPPPPLPVAGKPEPPLKALEILDLGDDLPANMKDDMPYALMKRLDRCHAEGFVDCVREHIIALAKCNARK
jgi:hypothetical protein